MNEKYYDVIIIGSGPAGLQAAIHAARRKATVLVMGRLHKSSIYSALIENYCCIYGNSGEDLLRQALTRAQESGSGFLNEDVTEITRENGFFIVNSEGGEVMMSKALILAMGITRNKLGIKAEKMFTGKGISYCVDCDAGFYRDRNVAIIGNGSAAVTGALILLFYAKDVHLICEKMEVADHLVEKVRESSIHMHENRKVVNITGKDSVEGVLLDNGEKIDVTGVFIELGAKGAMSVAGNLGVEMDKATMKFISTNKKQETNVPGVYAAGDIAGLPWQVAKAVGEGCIAGLEAAAYVNKIKQGTGEQ
jgi:thioredoxin reductase (NADPH)